MSLGRVRFDHVPPMYKVKTTRPLLAFLSPPEQLRYRLGFRGLRASLTVQPGPQSELYLNELITVRPAARLYTVAETGVAFEETGSPRASSGRPAPPRAAMRFRPAVRDQRVVGERSVSVEVREVGVEAFVRVSPRPTAS